MSVCVRHEPFYQQTLDQKLGLENKGHQLLSKMGKYLVCIKIHVKCPISYILCCPFTCFIRSNGSAAFFFLESVHIFHVC